MSEKWRPVVGFEGLYEVSSLGRMKRLARRVPYAHKTQGTAWRTLPELILEPNVGEHGYLIYHFMIDGQRRWQTAHVLVAAAFIGPCPPGHEVRHWDGDKQNNTPGNLLYGTRAENRDDARRLGTLAVGSRIAQAVLHESLIPAVRALQGRVTQNVAAATYGVSRATIRRVWRGESWRHV